MEPARGFAGPLGFHRFGDGSGERDHVVFDFAFDFLDTRKIKGGVRAKSLRGFARHFAQIRKRFASGEFYGEPAFVFVLFAPNGAHVGTSVSGNHSLTRVVGAHPSTDGLESRRS